jgi:hypothetical protein
MNKSRKWRIEDERKKKFQEKAHGEVKGLSIILKKSCVEVELEGFREGGGGTWEGSFHIFGSFSS